MPGAGSISPPFQAPFIVVRSSGSSGDDTARLQAALDKLAAKGYSDFESAGVPELVIDGLCNISSGLTYAGNPAIIRGATPYSGLNAITGAAAADMLTLNDGASAHNARGIHVLGVRFQSSVTKTAGAAIRLKTVAWTHVDRCSIISQYDGIVTELGSQQCQITRNGISGITRYGIRVGVYDAAGTSQGYGTEQYILDNMCYGAGSPVSGSAGIYVESGDALHIRGNNFVSFYYGMLFQPTANRNPGYEGIEVTGNISSDNASHACYIDGSTYKVNKLTLSDNHFVYCLTAGRGLHIDGANVRAISVRGGLIMSNADGGVYIGGGCRDVHVKDVMIGKNGVAGIELASTAQDFMLTGNRITNSNFGTGVGTTQPYGIKYGGSHDNCIITGNDLRGNGTAPTTGTAPTAGSTVVLTGNI